MHCQSYVCTLNSGCHCRCAACTPQRCPSCGACPTCGQSVAPIQIIPIQVTPSWYCSVCNIWHPYGQACNRWYWYWSPTWINTGGTSVTGNSYQLTWNATGGYTDGQGNSIQYGYNTN